ncbi:hypothetical protein PHYSODRAFT_352368 [Phytophthora sojae]|uniref:Secreted protein n=1 Tax=Phytophthora sojae (strain P6497) TaxID=1094619 RepID=G5A1F8_PHYSP|nr:hypothetical protein PHYSODRAFT_352368 [Phytophthora sojae]EGZ10757.1 hypothetical protein PHYSODRAFT_352368 [Phytophthora sojae]|eukprot:XP_009533502.1 hypothetical protein PHYSODRAFT_352368 [Phytophthora sojae]
MDWMRLCLQLKTTVASSAAPFCCCSALCRRTRERSVRLRLLSSTRSRWSSRRSSLSSSSRSSASCSARWRWLSTFSTMCARSSSVSSATACRRRARRSRRRRSMSPTCLLEKATHLSALSTCLEFSAGSSETESCGSGAMGDIHAMAAVDILL